MEKEITKKSNEDININIDIDDKNKTVPMTVGDVIELTKLIVDTKKDEFINEQTRVKENIIKNIFLSLIESYKKDFKLDKKDIDDYVRSITDDIQKEVGFKVKELEKSIKKETESNNTPKEIKEKLLKVGIDYAEIANTPNIPSLVSRVAADIRRVSSKTVSLTELDDVDFSSLTITGGKYVLGGGAVSDDVYGVGWDGITDIAPSKNAVYDKIETLAGGHDAVTVTDSAEIDFTLTGQDITASLIAGSIDETKLDTSTNTSLDLADSSTQPNDLVTTLNVSATSRIIGRTTAGAGVAEELTSTQVRTLINVEDGADVTDTANVTSAGALMDSEVDADIKTLSLPANTTITTAAQTVLDDATVGAMVDTLGGATSTGTGGLVRATYPTLVTPALGTPASGVMTNVTGTASGLTAGNVTTNANLTGHVTSTGNAAVLGSFTLAQLNTAISDGGTSQPYETIYVDAAAMVARTTNGAASSSEEYATNDVIVDSFLFDGATEEGVQFKVAMPDNWDLSTIKVKFFWDAATGASASDGVTFGISAQAIANDGVIDNAFGASVDTDDVVLAVGDLHVSPASSAITVSGTPAIGKMTWFEVTRVVGDAQDTMTEDAKLLGVQIQYGTLQTNVAIW